MKASSNISAFQCFFFCKRIMFPLSHVIMLGKDQFIDRLKWKSPEASRLRPRIFLSITVFLNLTSLANAYIFHFIPLIWFQILPSFTIRQIAPQLASTHIAYSTEKSLAKKLMEIFIALTAVHVNIYLKLNVAFIFE